MRFDQGRQIEIGSHELGLFEIRPGQSSVKQYGTIKIHTGQIGFAEIRHFVGMLLVPRIPDLQASVEYIQVLRICHLARTIDPRGPLCNVLAQASKRKSTGLARFLAGIASTQRGGLRIPCLPSTSPLATMSVA